MPRKDTIPSRRHYKRTGQAIVTLNGRDIYLTAPYADTAASVAEYDNLIANWLAAGRRLPNGLAEIRTWMQDANCARVTAVDEVNPDAPLSVNGLLLLFLEDSEKQFTRADGRVLGELDKLKVAMRPLVELYGETPAEDFGPLKLSKIREVFISQGLRRGYVNDQIRRVVKAFRWGVSLELIPPDRIHALRELEPLRRGRTAAPEDKKIEPVSDEQIDAAMTELSPTVQTMVQVQRLTGMRSTELCSMRVGDIDMSQAPWIYEPRHHKTEHYGKTRRIRLGPNIRSLITPYLKADPTAHVFDPRTAVKERHIKARRRRRRDQKPTPRMTKRKVQDHYTKDSFARAIRRACKRAGIREWHPHQLRHAFITEVANRRDILTAAELAGHASTKTTERYIKRDEKKLDEFVESRFG